MYLLRAGFKARTSEFQLFNERLLSSVNICNYLIIFIIIIIIIIIINNNTSNVPSLSKPPRTYSTFSLRPFYSKFGLYNRETKGMCV
jgi:hypothetical protein